MRMRVVENHCKVELTKMRYDDKKGKKVPVSVNMPRSIVDHKLAVELNALLNKQCPVEIDVAEKKLRLHKITDLDGRSSITLESIVDQHPLDFKIEGKHVVRAR